VVEQQRRVAVPQPRQQGVEERVEPLRRVLHSPAPRALRLAAVADSRS
jgi:hypothetical protein